ncbi:hypothetical protein EDB19DRAFT_1753542 [Suillus lakei]|nr:hypothetical protein EDB19DRAFT_1753542 [Suillus lakei]
MRHGDSIKTIKIIFLLFIVVKLVIIYWPWIQLLLLLLKPAEAKEENTRSCSVVHTDNVGVGGLSERNINDFYYFALRFACLLLPLA